MKRVAAVIACVALRLSAAGGGSGCGGGTLGGNGGEAPVTGISGSTGRGSGGVGSGGAAGSVGAGTAGSFNLGIGGDVAPPGVGGVLGAAGVVGAGGRGGVVGSGGRGGVIGVGGEFGTAGNRMVPCPPATPPVCGAACGNGVIDTCSRGSLPQCQGATATEECDSTNFGLDSCAARGFPSGKLICGSDCTLDASGCSACVPGASLVSCGPAPFGSSQANSFGLAATDSEVALAMITDDGSGTEILWFARLSPSLQTISVTAIDDTSSPGPLEGAVIQGTAVAPLASGWVVVVCGVPEIYIYTFDASGQAIRRTPVASTLDGGLNCLANTPVLAARPGGEVLLAWNADAGVIGSVIAADGRSVTPPQTIVPGAIAAGSEIAAAWIADSFYVAAAVYPVAGYYVRALRLVRVQRDGTVSDFADDLPSAFDGSPSFAVGAGDMRLVYRGTPEIAAPYDSGIIWQRIAPNNAELAPVELAMLPRYYAQSPAVAFGDDTVVLLGGAQGQALGVTRVALDGSIVTSPYDILAAPDFFLTRWEMVRRGPEVVVGWISDTPWDRIGLARVMP